MSRSYRRTKTDTQGTARLKTPYKTQRGGKTTTTPNHPTHSPLGATYLQIKGGCPPSRRDQGQFPPLLLYRSACSARL